MRAKLSESPSLPAPVSPLGTSGEIRTPINGFGDRYSTLELHSFISGAIKDSPTIIKIFRSAEMQGAVFLREGSIPKYVTLPKKGGNAADWCLLEIFSRGFW